MLAELVSRYKTKSQLHLSMTNDLTAAVVWLGTFVRVYRAAERYQTSLRFQLTLSHRDEPGDQ